MIHWLLLSGLNCCNTMIGTYWNNGKISPCFIIFLLAIPSVIPRLNTSPRTTSKRRWMRTSSAASRLSQLGTTLPSRGLIQSHLYFFHFTKHWTWFFWVLPAQLGWLDLRTWSQLKIFGGDAKIFVKAIRPTPVCSFHIFFWGAGGWGGGCFFFLRRNHARTSMAFRHALFPPEIYISVKKGLDVCS